MDMGKQPGIKEMKIINSSYEILSINDSPLRLIEIAGRTCYRSEDKITDDSAEKFAQMIQTKNHMSVIEHSFLSVRFVCSRGISHELVRHRLASFSQESTRYVGYHKDKFDGQVTYVWPAWIPKEERIYGHDDIALGMPSHKRAYWVQTLKQCEDGYMAMIKNSATAQEARGVLPNDLKTEIVMSANFREWKHVFELRCSKAAHPDMRELMIPLAREMNARYPSLFTTPEFV